MNSWQEQALHHAKISLPDESCGLVVDVDGKQQYLPCKNLAIEGATSFTIDPEDWVKAEETGTVLHICHSHPNGDLTASDEDIKNCDYKFPCKDQNGICRSKRGLRLSEVMSLQELATRRLLKRNTKEPVFTLN